MEALDKQAALKTFFSELVLLLADVPVIISIQTTAQPPLASM